MTKEIKLMLNIIKDVSEHKEGSRNGLMILSCKDYKTLYDYITNLQQENENLNKTLEEHDETLENTFNLVGQLLLRIDKAIEFIKEKISSTKGVINDYMYHKEHNKHLIELLNEDIEMYKNELNILQGDKE